MTSLAALESHLRATIEGEVRFDVGTRAAYATDASNYRQVPVGVVIPRHEGDVIAALSLARENAMPILARGGGTSLAGQGCNAALVLDFSKYMNRIIAIDPGARVAQVEPGVVQSHLNAALAPHGLFFAPDPSTKDRCTIGGMIGNNSCGAHSAAYGKTVDNVEALEVILHDGTRVSAQGSMDEAQLGAAIARGGREGELYSRLRELRDRTADSVRAHFPKLPRRVSGYNLDELMPERGFNLARAIVGSEGTLATIIRATIRAVPRPKELALGGARIRRRVYRGRSNAMAAGASPGSARGLRRESAGVRADQGDAGRAVSAGRARLSAGRARRRIARRGARAC